MQEALLRRINYHILNINEYVKPGSLNTFTEYTYDLFFMGNDGISKFDYMPETESKCIIEETKQDYPVDTRVKIAEEIQKEISKWSFEFFQELCLEYLDGLNVYHFVPNILAYAMYHTEEQLAMYIAFTEDGMTHKEAVLTVRALESN